MAKKIYELGEIPELGVIPDEMYAWVIEKIDWVCLKKLCRLKRCQYKNLERMKFL